MLHYQPLSLRLFFLHGMPLFASQGLRERRCGTLWYWQALWRSEPL